MTCLCVATVVVGVLPEVVVVGFLTQFSIVTFCGIDFLRNFELDLLFWRWVSKVHCCFFFNSIFFFLNSIFSGIQLGWKIFYSEGEFFIYFLLSSLCLNCVWLLRKCRIRGRKLEAFCFLILCCHIIFVRTLKRHWQKGFIWYSIKDTIPYWRKK